MRITLCFRKIFLLNFKEIYTQFSLTQNLQSRFILIWIWIQQDVPDTVKNPDKKIRIRNIDEIVSSNK